MGPAVALAPAAILARCVLCMLSHGHHAQQAQRHYSMARQHSRLPRQCHQASKLHRPGRRCHGRLLLLLSILLLLLVLVVRMLLLWVHQRCHAAAAAAGGARWDHGSQGLGPQGRCRGRHGSRGRGARVGGAGASRS